MSGELTILDGGMGAELISAVGRQGAYGRQKLLEKPEGFEPFTKTRKRRCASHYYEYLFTVPSYLAKENMQSRYVELTGIAARLARGGGRGPSQGSLRLLISERKLSA